MTSAEKSFFKKYGKTRTEVNSMSSVCMICGAAPKTRRLDTDHDHRFKNFKIHTLKGAFSGVWWAGIPELAIGCSSGTRKEAREAVKLIAKGQSVRGVLCHLCNRGIRLMRDSPSKLRAAAAYLEAFANKTGVVYT